MLVDHGIDLALAGDRALDQILEEGLLDLAVSDLVARFREAVQLELRDDLVQVGLDEIHLIKRLHGGEPRAVAGFRPRMFGLPRLGHG